MRAGKTPGGWENTQEAKWRGEKTPLRPLLEETEVCVIQATGRRGVNPAGFLLGALLLQKDSGTINSR